MIAWPPGREDAVEVAQDLLVGGDVLEDVQADDRVERVRRPAARSPRPGSGPSGRPEVLQVAEPAMDHLDIERVEVAGDQPVAVEQQLGEVADPAAGLEHVRPTKGAIWRYIQRLNGRALRTATRM